MASKTLNQLTEKYKTISYQYAKAVETKEL